MTLLKFKTLERERRTGLVLFCFFHLHIHIQNDETKEREIEFVPKSKWYKVCSIRTSTHVVCDVQYPERYTYIHVVLLVPGSTCSSNVHYNVTKLGKDRPSVDST